MEFGFTNNFNSMILNEVPDANVAGEELERIKSKHGDEFTGRDVVDESRDEEAALHPVFEWDNDEAGERWREHQADSLVRSVRILPSEEGESASRAFTSVRVKDAEGKATGKRVYRETTAVLAEPQTREEVLMECLQGLVRWRKRWHEYNELADSIEIVDDAIGRIQTMVAAE